VAAGRVGDVAAVAHGGLVGAVGAVVGAHGLAQPAMVGTVRLSRQPARAPHYQESCPPRQTDPPGGPIMTDAIALRPRAAG
jgi:hypothetical protein